MRDASSALEAFSAVGATFVAIVGGLLVQRILELAARQRNVAIRIDEVARSREEDAATERELKDTLRAWQIRAVLDRVAVWKLYVRRSIDDQFGSYSSVGVHQIMEAAKVSEVDGGRLANDDAFLSAMRNHSSTANLAVSRIRGIIDPYLSGRFPPSISLAEVLEDNGVDERDRGIWSVAWAELSREELDRQLDRFRHDPTGRSLPSLDLDGFWSHAQACEERAKEERSLALNDVNQKLEETRSRTARNEIRRELLELELVREGGPGRREIVRSLLAFTLAAIMCILAPLLALTFSPHMGTARLSFVLAVTVVGLAVIIFYIAHLGLKVGRITSVAIPDRGSRRKSTPG